VSEKESRRALLEDLRVNGPKYALEDARSAREFADRVGNADRGYYQKHAQRKEERLQKHHPKEHQQFLAERQKK
jgi:hypothetical protein